MKNKTIYTEEGKAIRVELVRCRYYYMVTVDGDAYYRTSNQKFAIQVYNSI